MGLGVGPQQAETHLFRGKRSGWVLRICNTNALLAIIMPNLAQTWLYQKRRKAHQQQDFAHRNLV